MRTTPFVSLKVLMTISVLAAVLLGGCARGSHSGQTSNNLPTVQQSSSETIDSQAQSLDQDLQNLKLELATPELAPEVP